MLEFEEGVLLLDVVSDGVTGFGLSTCGAMIDPVVEANEHCMPAVEQLTHIGRFSSHCKLVSGRSYNSCHTRGWKRLTKRASIYLNVTPLTFCATRSRLFMTSTKHDRCFDKTLGRAYFTRDCEMLDVEILVRQYPKRGHVQQGE